MGFRSTFTTSDCYVSWPDWFRDKYADSIVFPQTEFGSICSRRENKVYGAWIDLAEDIQRAITWNDVMKTFALVFLHECDGITRAVIRRDRIEWSEPVSWKTTDGPTHSYCYDCSTVPQPCPTP